MRVRRLKYTFVSLAIWFCHTWTIHAGDANGQKAHFQVHNKKTGSMMIHATKMMATITATADSVQMVVDPGEEIIEPKGGGDSSKRDFSIHLDNSSDVKSIYIKRNHVTLRSSNTPATLKKSQNKNLEHFKQLKRTNSKKMFKKFHQKIAPKDTKRHKSKQHDVNASKKSLVDKEMRVHGQTGRLHVHTDHNLTALHSESGKLEIYIKNPDHDEVHHEAARRHHPDITVQVKTEAYKKDKEMIPISDQSITAPGRLHILQDSTGLKRSGIDESHQKRKQKQMCSIPPCSNVVSEE